MREAISFWRKPAGTLLIAAAVIGGWILLQTVILPGLGVPT